MRGKLLAGKALLSFGFVSITMLSGCAVPLATPTYNTFTGKFIETERVRSIETKGITPGDGRNRAPRPNPDSQDIRALSGRPDLIAMTEYLNDAGLVEDQSLETYLASTLDQLLSRWPWQRPAVSIFVRASDDFAPHSTIGNDIFLTLGTLNNVENEHQLAGVLAHELAHILLRHFDREAFINQQKETITAGSSLAILGATLADFKAQDRAGGGFALVQQHSESNRNVMLGAVAANLVLNEFADTIVDRTWTREQENEADLLAVDLMVRAGFDPAEFQAVIQKLRVFEENRATEMQEFEKKFLAAYTKAAEAGNIQFMLNNVISSVAGAGTSMLKDLRTLLRRTHMSWETRMEAIAEYAQREYSDRDEPADRRHFDHYDRKVNSGRIKAVRDNYAAALQANRHLAEGEIAEAERMAVQGASGVTSDDAYPRYVLSIVQLRTGKRDHSLRNLQFATRSLLAPAAVYTDLASRYVAMKRGADGVDTLNLGSQRFGGDELFLPSYIQIYQQLGRDEDAAHSYERCVSSKSDTLKEACNMARGGTGKQPPGSWRTIFDIFKPNPV